MAPMKSNTTHSLFVCMILMAGYLNPVTAVTDAELEALEKQIEQQEAEEKKKAEAEAKRKVEQKRKAEAEVEKKRLVELEKQRQEEQRRLTELERKRQEEEAKKRAEEEKKEKYTLLIAEAEQAVRNKDKELAISKYNEVLVIAPNNPVANSGLKEAEKLMDKVCYAFFGKWVWEKSKETMEILENGTIITSSLLGDKTFNWTCIPENRQLKHDRIITKKYKNLLFLTLSEDGTCISDPLLWPSDGCWRKQGY